MIRAADALIRVVDRFETDYSWEAERRGALAAVPEPVTLGTDDAVVAAAQPDAVAWGVRERVPSAA